MSIMQINRMLAMHALSLVLLLPTAACANSSTVVAYPVNPNLQADALFVAGQGVARYDRVTMERIWSALHDHLLGEPLIAGSRLLIAGNRNLYALDSLDGRIIWQYRFQKKLFNPVLTHDRLIVTDVNGSVYALSVETGEILWQINRAPGWLYPPAIGVNLVMTGGQDREVFALDAITGESRWRRKLDQELVYSPLATDSEGIVVTTFSGGVFMLQSENGNELWETRFGTPAIFPSIVDRRLLLSEMDGTLHALDPDSGETIWRQALPSRLIAPASGQDGLLLATVEGGRVFILDSDSGAILKQYRLGVELIGSPRFAGNRILVVIEGRNRSGPVPVYIEELQDRLQIDKEERSR